MAWCKRSGGSRPTLYPGQQLQQGSFGCYQVTMPGVASLLLLSYTGDLFAQLRIQRKVMTDTREVIYLWRRQDYASRGADEESTTEEAELLKSCLFLASFPSRASESSRELGQGRLTLFSQVFCETVSEAQVLVGLSRFSATYSGKPPFASSSYCFWRCLLRIDMFLRDSMKSETLPRTECMSIILPLLS
jgi:hypothetical protein